MPSLRRYPILERALRSLLSGFGLVVGLAAAAALVALGVIVLAAGSTDDGGGEAAPDKAAAPLREPGTAGAPEPAAARPRHRHSHRRHQAADREAATEFAAGRQGRVAYAEADPDGTVRGHDEHELFQTASMVKALILAAELERLDREHLRLDPSTRSALTAMITVSDNAAASAIYDRIGPEGIAAVAHRAGMSDIETSEIWGATRVSAADMARFFSDLDRVLPARYERFGKGLLGSVTADQSWGIPAVARPLGWNVRFKGGWRPDPSGQVTNQAAELDRNGTRIAIAVLSDEGPSMPYGIETVEGVAARLLGR